MHARPVVRRKQLVRPWSRGFSLIEMMIVVVIVAILAAVAYPSYTRYVQKTRRSDATLLLSITAQRLERCHAECNSYLRPSVVDPAKPKACDTACPTLSDAIVSTDGYYQIVGVDGGSSISAHSFTLVAKPVAGKSQVNDKECSLFSLDSTKSRWANSDPPTTIGTTSICWN